MTESDPTPPRLQAHAHAVDGHLLAELAAKFADGATSADAVAGLLATLKNGQDLHAGTQQDLLNQALKQIRQLVVSFNTTRRVLANAGHQSHRSARNIRVRAHRVVPALPAPLAITCNAPEAAAFGDPAHPPAQA